MHCDMKKALFPRSSSMLRGVRVAIEFSAMFFLTGISLAQVDRSGLAGTVTDSSGRLLTKVHVTAVESATGLSRETVSDDSGSYSIPQLPVGDFAVAFDRPGFKKLEFSHVVQVIGRTRTLDATLQVSGGEERAEVSAASALLDRNTSAVTGLIEKEQAAELPLNGRDWSSLTAFVPGAIDTGGGNQRTVRFAGRGLDDSNFTYDGVDAGNIVNQTQRQWVRLAIPVDAIAEFRIDTLGSTAEEGATGGAQLAVTSPSGSNQFHGRLFEYIRNNAFDAPLPLWASGNATGAAQQPLRLNQFGGSLGGPILRNKTFFFLSSEAYRQNWGYPVSADVPSASLIATVPSTSPVHGIINGFPKAGPKAILTPYTAATDPTDYQNVDLLTCECAQVVNESSVMLRLDQHFSSKTTGFMRFSYDRSVDTQPVSVSATDLQTKVSTPVNGALELLYVFSPRLVNETHAGFNRSTNNAYNYSDSGNIYQIKIATGPGVGFATQNYNYITIYAGNSYSGNDNLTWVHDRHTVKAGFEYRRIQLNQQTPQHGTITFSTVEALASNSSTGVSSASLTGALPLNHLRKNDYFLYAQDEYKLRQNFNLNLGLRYTIFDLFKEKEGQANPFDFSTCGAQGYCGLGASFGQQNYGDVDPRVAFAWTPWNNGATVLRGGFGINHEDGQLDDQNLPTKNETCSYSLTNTSYSVAESLAPASSGLPTSVVNDVPNCAVTVNGVNLGTASSPSAEQRNRKDSYVEQWSLAVQRELPANFVGTLSYLGSHGVHLLEESYVNLDIAGVTQYPAYALGLGWRGSIGMSTYNGLSLALRRPFSNGLLVTANYMWSHEIDNGSNGSGDGDELQPQNPLCQACETASGAYDARNVVNGNAVYELPFGHGKALFNQGGIAGAIASGWQLTTTALARDGFPVNVLMPSSYKGPYGYKGQQRPSLVPGVSLTPPGGRTIAEWINPAAFTYPTTGQFGTAPRNLVAAPGTWQIDLGAGKRMSLPEKAQLQFRAEFYNIFNHPQLGAPNATCSLTTSSPTGCPAGFAAITNTVNTVSPVTPVGSGTPREIQLALRLDF